VEARGRFFVIEGGEGAGKSTLLRALAGRIAAAGRECVATREPGGTPLGERIRDLVLAHDAPLDSLAELLLFEAARAQLVATVIRPALDRGAVVVCDRFAASSIAYQSYGRGLPRDAVERANAVATGGLSPDLVLLLDLPVADGLARRAGDGGANRFEREDAAFHERVRQGFLSLAREEPERWRVIDATGALDGVTNVAWTAVEPILR
jgi:dTMP kinase